MSEEELRKEIHELRHVIDVACDPDAQFLSYEAVRAYLVVSLAEIRPTSK